MLANQGTVCDGEILERYLCNRLSWHWSKASPQKQYKTNKALNLEKYIRHRLRLSPASAYICEFKPFQLALTGNSCKSALEACNTLGFTHYVLLSRRNHLKVVTSATRAMEQGLWHSTTTNASQPIRLPLECIPFDRGRYSLLECLEKLSKNWSELESVAPPNAIRISYEDDIQSNPAKAAEKITRLIGLENFKKPDLKKTSKGQLDEQILNWDEICDLLKGTRFQWMAELDTKK
ncbi:Stf0 family sulfotransferase [Puniceicoccaceae bacterium K14]|nr:Stf0 family sulfotransferase [Puniceicoccaceae bacterium K14]